MIQEELIRLFIYDGDRLYRRTTGKEAGSIDLSRGGYVEIMVNGKLWKAHRLIWIYVYGYEPAMIDHINRVRDDNRLDNLRETTYSANMRNAKRYNTNKTGIVGVSYDKTRDLYNACIYINRNYNLGNFRTIEEAASARFFADSVFEFENG